MKICDADCYAAAILPYTSITSCETGAKPSIALDLEHARPAEGGGAQIRTRTAPTEDDEHDCHD